MEHISGEGNEQYLISISLVLSYCFLKAQRATETVKVIFIVQCITAEVDLTKSPQYLSKSLLWARNVLRERKEGNPRIREQVKQTITLTQTSH